MSEKNIAIASAYYEAMNKKDLGKLATFLHADVRLIGPMAEVHGKEAVLNSVKHFSALFESLSIRERFGLGDKAVIIYDVAFPLPIGLSRGSSLLTIEEGKITRVELFYDARPFEKKRDEIFSKLG